MLVAGVCCAGEGSMMPRGVASVSTDAVSVTIVYLARSESDVTSQRDHRRVQSWADFDVSSGRHDCRMGRDEPCVSFGK